MNAPSTFCLGKVFFIASSSGGRTKGGFWVDLGDCVVLVLRSIKKGIHKKGIYIQVYIMLFQRQLRSYQGFLQILVVLLEAQYHLLCVLTYFVFVVEEPMVLLCLDGFEWVTQGGERMVRLRPPRWDCSLGVATL